jgi:hypothetical protein
MTVNIRQQNSGHLGFPGDTNWHYFLVYCPAVLRRLIQLHRLGIGLPNNPPQRGPDIAGHGNWRFHH